MKSNDYAWDQFVYRSSVAVEVVVGLLVICCTVPDFYSCHEPSAPIKSLNEHYALSSM